MNPVNESLAERAKIAKCEQPVLDALIARQRHGHEDTTTHEIVEMLARDPRTAHLHEGKVAPRLNDLRRKGVIEKAKERRHDAYTRRYNLRPVDAHFIPAQQARLVP
jgi:predicted transcriptional regulator